ncbi:MAG: hypothetical protein FWD26_01835 [Treponema sp.]|nr:hypothetical protein [Treponema sp.]
MIKKVFILVLTLIILGACDLKPDADADLSADGIVIYSGREILNDREIEIVTNRVQRLYAIVPSGHIVEWSSDNPEFIEVDSAGVVRTGRTANKEAVIKVVSAVNPAIWAQVKFITKGLR